MRRTDVRCALKYQLEMRVCGGRMIQISCPVCGHVVGVPPPWKGPARESYFNSSYRVRMIGCVFLDLEIEAFGT